MKAVGVRTKDELKPRTNKTSSSSNLKSLKVANTYVDHECQTDDEMELDVNVDMKTKVKKSHTQRSQELNEKGYENLNQNDSDQDKLKSEILLESKDPSDSGISEKSGSENIYIETSSYPPSNGITVNESNDETVDGKNVLKPTQVHNEEDGSSPKKEESRNEVASKELSEIEGFAAPFLDKKKKSSVDENKKKFTDEMTDKHSDVRDRNDPHDLNNVPFESPFTDKVKDTKDKSKKAVKVSKQTDNESDDHNADHIPLWESCYFTDSDPCSEGEAKD